MMNQHRIIPFYEAYHIPAYPMQGYMPFIMAQDDTAEQDLQYLQEIFPEASRRYARKISDVVDRLDYKGSMIYDEFPDRMRIQRLAEEIVAMIEKEEAEKKDTEKENEPGGTEDGMMDRACRTELVYVLLCYEIYKRRHGSSRTDMARFYGTSF